MTHACMSQLDFQFFWAFMGWEPVSIGNLIIAGGHLYIDEIDRICIYAARGFGYPV